MAGSVGEGHHILRGPLAVTAGWEDHPTRAEGKRGLTALGSGMLALRSNREPGQRTLGGLMRRSHTDLVGLMRRVHADLVGLMRGEQHPRSLLARPLRALPRRRHHIPAYVNMSHLLIFYIYINS